MVSIADEHKRYVVLLPEMMVAGRAMFAGDTFEARNTVEVLTHVALGNIILATDYVPPGSIERPEPPNSPAGTPPDSPATQSKQPAAEFPAARRRYLRRDMKADE